MNSEQEKIQCKEKLLDNITGLKAVVNNFESVVSNSNYLDSYQVNNTMNVIGYFLKSIETGVALVNHAQRKYLDELEDLNMVVEDE